uniref:AP-4 complex accessory subunit Tepsin isoform X2 n=1 Tax=Doryrhamphus excisus TaxID=161450 RepID=UPI0025AE0D47|nr:AP-4 complex accessory subunit Tepsin isoform X2 [Doryrhamphus excisus]
MATFMERLAFLQKVPTLMKATADDENPCPGYLFQEIGKISHESSASDQCLLEYLLERLQVESCHVKLKVLKIFVHLCGHGSKHFLTELRRNSTFIQQASVYSGPPHPIHGTALYQKVRKTAQEVARLLFTDTISIKSGVLPLNVVTPTMGMGSAATHRSAMQGFGYNPGRQGTGTDSLLDKIQKAAEVVASAVLPPTEHQGIRLHDNQYRAVVAPSAPIEVAVPACAYGLPARKSQGVIQRCPGQVGGGWEETDSGNTSSHHSSQDILTNSRASVSSKSICTGSQSGASRESSGDLSERVEALQLGDCGQEMALISKLMEGSRVFLSSEESQHFIKECSTLNCEVVVELLSSGLQDPSNTVKMRVLCAVSCLMTTDLLSLEQIFGATQRRLRQLSEDPPGAVANKATKILRQFQALMGGVHHTAKQHPASSQPVNHTSSQLLTHSHANHPFHVNSVSSPEFIDNEEKHLLTEQQLALDSVRTVDTEAAKEEESTSSGEPSSVSRPSLFSGMNLLTRGRPQCESTTSHTDIDSLHESVNDNQTAHQFDGASPGVFDSSQQASAFSFLNS